MTPDALCRSRAPLPVWVPEAARLYLSHTGAGRTLRELARASGCHASTILRRCAVWRRGARICLWTWLSTPLARPISRRPSLPAAEHEDRDDPHAPRHFPPFPQMTPSSARPGASCAGSASPGACLAVAKDMEKAVVVREAGGQTVRTAVVDRAVAEAMALNDWIACDSPGRIARYHVTAAGRSALKRLLAEDERDAFGAQHRDMEERDETDAAGRRTGARVRYNMAESPLALLARRRDKDGQPFLTDRMVLAGERLREDFELAQMGPRVAQNWDRFLTAGDRGVFAGDGGLAEGPKAARDRVLAALTDLGPGSATWCCAAAAFSKGSRRWSGAWAGRRGRARSCSASRCSGSAGTTTRADGWSPLVG
jgi:hypothetical protein